MGQQGEPVEVGKLVVDAATARYLMACARQRGGSMAEAAARQLRELALADSVTQHAAFTTAEPSFFEDAEAERTEALSA